MNRLRGRSAEGERDSGMTRAAAGQAGHAGGRGRDSREAAGVAARQEPAADVALPEQTLALAASGDDAAWRLVLERYGRRVFAMVLSRLRDPDLAEELTQAVFVKVAEQWATGEYTERGRFESWLFRITMNRVRDEARRLSELGEFLIPGVLTEIVADAVAEDVVLGVVD